jgi:hypothetical protein
MRVKINELKLQKCKLDKNYSELKQMLKNWDEVIGTPPDCEWVYVEEKGFALLFKHYLLTVYPIDSLTELVGFINYHPHRVYNIKDKMQSFIIDEDDGRKCIKL